MMDFKTFFSVKTGSSVRLYIVMSVSYRMCDVKQKYQLFKFSACIFKLNKIARKL